MSILLQILIGIIPLFIISLIIMIKRKYYRLSSITTVLLILILISGLAYHSLSSPSIAQGDFQSQNTYLVGKYIIEEDYNSASTLLNHLYKTTEYDKIYTLYAARIEFLKGSLDNAAVLYEKASNLYLKSGDDSFPKSECAYFDINHEQFSFNDISKDAPIVRYLSYMEEDPRVYGFLSLEKYNTFDIIEERRVQRELILKNLNRELSNKKQEEQSIATFDKGANLVITTDAIYNNYINGEYVDRDELKRVLRRFDEISSTDPKVMANEHLRLAQLKAMALEGSFKDMVRSTGSITSQSELMILSELYIEGHVKSSDFPEGFGSVNPDMYNKVIEQCEKVLLRGFDNESKQVKLAAKGKIQGLHKESKHRVLAEIKSRMTENLANTPLEEQSKIFMQLSKIDSFLGNTTSADSVMEKSMDKVSYCADSSFSTPMYKIISVINGIDSSDTIKNVPLYVSEVLENTLPIRIDQSYNTNNVKDSLEDEKRFEQYFTNYISKKKAIINIGAIDITDFPVVKAKVQFGSDSVLNETRLKNMLDIYDCGVKINDFKVEKINYSKSKIVLCCDASGSMKNDVSALKNAVAQFISDMNKNEFVSIVGFDDRIKFDYDFTDNVDELNQAVHKLGAYGGTDMYSALLYSMDKFSSEDNTSNTIILMTDGQDNHKKSIETIKSVIGKGSNENNITIYTIGLGVDADTQYLQTLSKYGNGKFIFCNDAISLNEFYDFIHNQLSSQYIITYTAQNTVDNSRQLTVSLPEYNAKDNKQYYLFEETSTHQDNPSSIVTDNKGINFYGLNTKLLYKDSSSYHDILLSGEGFTTLRNLSISLSGITEHIIKNPKIISDNVILLTVPSNIPVGIFDLIIQGDEKLYLLNRELTIAIPSIPKTINFGRYTLSSLEIINEGNHRYRLRGDVTLNNFIRFKEDLIIEGDYKSNTSITLIDNSGSYIAFDKESSLGLAKTMASIGRPLNLWPLGKFMIYNDEAHKYDYENYKVQKITLVNPMLLSSLAFEHPGICIFPDRIEIQFGGIGLDFPFQKEILKYKGYDPFTIKAGGKAVITSDAIGLLGHYSSDINLLGKSGLDKKVSIINFPLSLDDLDAKINTLHNDYSLLAKVKLDALKKDIKVGMMFSIEGGKFDTIKLIADFDVNITKTPVPITLSDFQIGIEGMSKTEQGEGFKAKLLNSYLTGQLDIHVFKLDSLLPFLSDFLPDASLLKLDDATAKCRLNQFSLIFEADLELFGEIKMMKSEVRIGNFDYNNHLLDIPSQEVVGLYAYYNRGIEWDTPNIKIDVKGEHAYSANNKFVGVWSTGIIDYDVNWYLIDSENSYNGNVLLGIHSSDDNKKQFTIIIKGIDLRKNKQKGIRIVFKDGSILPKMNFY